MNKIVYSERRSFYTLLTILLVAYSCSTPLNELTYFDGIKAGHDFPEAPLPQEYLIRPNDHLYIRIISDDPEDAAFLNLIGSQTSMIGSASNIELITYLVGEDGNISYPFLGPIKVENKTLNQIQAIMQTEVDKYLEKASVFVKLVSRTVTVLGEVRNPGQLSMIKSRMNIFETLGLAGDITDYGNRQNVKLIRELSAGRHVEELDLTNPMIISSPYFYILPHDILYVEHKTKVYGAKNMPYASPISITASVISIGLLILNLFK
jgi:polysaccharide export outer membrane protein